MGRWEKTGKGSKPKRAHNQVSHHGGQLQPTPTRNAAKQCSIRALAEGTEALTHRPWQSSSGQTYRRWQWGSDSLRVTYRAVAGKWQPPLWEGGSVGEAAREPPSLNMRPRSGETTHTWLCSPLLQCSEGTEVSLPTSLMYTAPLPGAPVPILILPQTCALSSASSLHSATLALPSTFKVIAPWRLPWPLSPTTAAPPPQMVSPESWPRSAHLGLPSPTSQAAEQLLSTCQRRQLSSKRTSVPMKGTAN